jgi:hypothetical protein
MGLLTPLPAKFLIVIPSEARNLAVRTVEDQRPRRDSSTLLRSLGMTAFPDRMNINCVGLNRRRTMSRLMAGLAVVVLAGLGAVAPALTFAAD